MLKAVGPVPWGPSHCSCAVGSPPGQEQTKVTAPEAGSTAQEGCPSGGSGREVGVAGAGAGPTADALQPQGSAGCGGSWGLRRQGKEKRDGGGGVGEQEKSDTSEGLVNKRLHSWVKRQQLGGWLGRRLESLGNPRGHHGNPQQGSVPLSHPRLCLGHIVSLSSLCPSLCLSSVSGATGIIT